MYRWELKMSLEFVCSILSIHSHVIYTWARTMPLALNIPWFNFNISEMLLFTSWTYHNGLNFHGLCYMQMFCMSTSDTHCFSNHCSILFLHVPSHEQHNKVLYLYQVFKDLILLEFIIWLHIVSICFVKQMALIFLCHVSG